MVAIRAPGTASRSAARPSGPAASRSAIVRGPPARTVAAGSQRSASAIPRVSPVSDRHDNSRTIAPVVQYSVRWTEDWTIRYGRHSRQPARRPHRRSHGRRPQRASPARTDGPQRQPSRVRRCLDRRPVFRRRRRRGDRHRPSCLGSRHPLLRHRTALRLRRLGTSGGHRPPRPTARRVRRSRPRSDASSGTRQRSRRRRTSIGRNSMDARMRTTSAPVRSGWSSTTAPTAFAGRSRRAWSGSASTESTSR